MVKDERDLVKLSRHVERKFLELKHEFVTVQVSTRRGQSRHAGSVVIDVLSLWASFVRAYYVSCVRAARRSSGAAVSTVVGPVSRDRAIGRAITYYRPTATPSASGKWNRRDEPTWHDKTVLHGLARHFSFSNISVVDVALSVTTRAFTDMATIRNFFAHKNDQTAQSAMAVGLLNGVASSKSPLDTIKTIPVGRHQSLLEEWIDDLVIVVQLLAL